MKPSTSRIHGLHYVVDDDGEILRTPAGLPIGCISEDVLKIAARDISEFGSDPTDAISLFSLFCTYLDFGDTPRSELINSLITALEDDVVYRELAMQVTMGDVATDDDEVLGSPYPEDFLKTSGFYSQFEVEMEGFGGAINYQKLADWLLGQLETATPRHLACLQYCATNLNCLLPALALLSSSYDTEDFKELIEDRVSERESALIDQLRAFAALPEDRDAVIANVESTTA